MSRRIEGDLLGARVFVASPEDTVISKLEWAKQGGGSQLQLRDVSGILQLRGNELDIAYIERWVAELDLGELWRSVRGDLRLIPTRRHHGEVTGHLQEHHRINFSDLI
jgi:hypothetical protein